MYVCALRVTHNAIVNRPTNHNLFTFLFILKGFSLYAFNVCYGALNVNCPFPYGQSDNCIELDLKYLVVSRQSDFFYCHVLLHLHIRVCFCIFFLKLNEFI